MTSVKEAKLSSDPVLSSIDFEALSIDQVTDLRAAAAAEIRRRRGGKPLAVHVDEVIRSSVEPVSTAQIREILADRGVPTTKRGLSVTLALRRQDFGWVISKSSFPATWTCGYIKKKAVRDLKVSRATEES